MENGPKAPGSAKKHQTPFVGELVDSGMRTGKIFALEHDPSKLVRAESFEELGERYGARVEMHELVFLTKRLYSELKSDYGIAVPANFLIGKDGEGRNVVYSVIDKINGSTLEKAENSERLVVAIETLYTSLTKYFLDKLQSGDAYLCDIGSPAQYMYGKRSGEQEDNMYLVDTDVSISKNQAGIYVVVEWLTRFMSSMERRVGKKFDVARANLQQFAEVPVRESGMNADAIVMNLDHVRRILDGDMHVTSPEAIPPFE